MKSGRVRSQDWQALFHLAGDLADVPAGDAEASLRLLMEPLFRMIGARGGFWTSSARIMSREAAGSDPLCGWRPSHVLYSDPCPGAYEIRLHWAAQIPNFVSDPYPQAALRDHGRHRTFLRAQLLDDSIWKRSLLFNEVLRPIGIGDRMTGVLSISPAIEVFVCADRSSGEKPFGVRERELLRAAMEGFSSFHRRVLHELELIESAQTLTQRERQMLPLLLSSRSEKQISRALGLTVRTTHFYVASVYRKFRVHSRAELMSLWVPGSKQRVSRRNDVIPHSHAEHENR